ncbi:Uncharacterized protein DAT39_011596, partial [Clarias magur]
PRPPVSSSSSSSRSASVMREFLQEEQLDEVALRSCGRIRRRPRSSIPKSQIYTGYSC